MNSILSKEKKINIIKAFFVFVIFFLSGYIQGILALLFHINVKKITDLQTLILILLADLIILSLIILIYYKDLKKEWKIFRENFSTCFDTGLKYWLVGLFVMIVSNSLIAMFTNLGTSENESMVQSLIPASPILMIVVAGIFAPFIEEITFRKNIQNIFSNQWIAAIICFLLFGYIHVAGAKNPLEYLYIIPYGSLGFFFSLAYSKTKTVFTSTTMHMIHNIALILLSVFVVGA